MSQSPQYQMLVSRAIELFVNEACYVNYFLLYLDDVEDELVRLNLPRPDREDLEFLVRRDWHWAKPDTYKAVKWRET